ncbi:homocysteine-responsive endoplasmic reticulum-resident ubiquitin-like domain member 1 protein isoform X2 [Xiphias gladius]|uniref:homocysteine-responsive endoplasmic reticulum-resident ubiquitin-like domain member 1 protein isoform X2 n=1 Tax=Xiphias gladius TaxID=8245 RepID=UPI001A997327|nr:homocysteine-responsive endoplasmic reticulum-resident ubiquitin-like domain member 1 protein isoform X2 [Xiphias gladius]
MGEQLKIDVGASQQKTITLLIKTPNQAQEDQIVECVNLNWTVKDLKTRLSTVYPTKPAVSDQRLICGGKLLPDHLHIKDIFKWMDSVPTLHLVCAFRNQPQGPLEARPKTTETEQPHPSGQRPIAASASPGPSSSFTVQMPNTPELRQRRWTSSTSAPAPAHVHTPASPLWTPAWPAAAMPGAPQMTQPTFPTCSLYSSQQLLWLQHVYARQYYMQYHAALAASGTVPSIPASIIGQYRPVPAQQVPVPPHLAHQNPINNLPANQNPAQDGAFMNLGEADQNMRMNAQGGPVMEDEEDIESDWLDWLYSAARFCVLLMIVYFNSNLSRFLLVMSALFLMYLHTAGWFPFRRLQFQGPNHLQPPEVQHNHQNENRIPNPYPAVERADRQREEPAAAVDGSDGQEQMTAVLVPPHRVSVMWTAWVFFKTFFSSLIPEVPQAMAN